MIPRGTVVRTDFTDLALGPDLGTGVSFGFFLFFTFLAHSMSLYNRAASVVCPSVRPSARPPVNFCANRFFSRANGRIVTKLAHGGVQVSVHPECAQGQGQGQRSRDTGTFVLARKSLLLAGKWPDRHQTCI